MNLRPIVIALFFTTSIYTQDWERVAPKEPTEFESGHGTLYSPEGTIKSITDGDKVIIPQLKGVLLTSENTTVTQEEINRAIGRVDTLNIRLPGPFKSLNEDISNKFLNRPLTKQDALELKQEIIFFYQRWGRPVVTLEIPQQKINDGVLQLIVIEGKFGQVRVEGNRYFKSKTLTEYIRLQEGEAIDSNILIEDVDWMNRNPFRQVDIIYAPGEVAGTTDIRLLTKDRRPYRFYAGVDNTGYDETENTRLFVGANWGNVFGLDQILSIQFTCAPNVNRFWAGTGSYTIPLPWRDVWDFYGGYSQVQGDMDTPGLKNKGYSAQASTRYNFILKPHPGHLHDLILGLDYKRTNNNLEYGGNSVFRQSINLTQLVFGYNSAFDSEWMRSSFSLEFFYSPGTWLPEQSNADYRQVRYKGNAHYLYGRFSFEPIIRLPKDFAFAVTLRGQASTQNLIASEQYGLGGYNTVRGYKEREVNVDDAFLLSTELRSPAIGFIGKNAFKDLLQFLIFLDYGIGRNVHKEPGEQASQYLLGFGPGVRYDIGPYLNFRGDLGVQLHKLDSRGFRFHFSLIASY